MADSFREALIVHACGRIHLLMIIFSISVLFILLLFVSITVVDPNSGTFVIVVMDLVGLLAFAGFSGAAILVCRDRD